MLNATKTVAIVPELHSADDRPLGAAPQHTSEKHTIVAEIIKTPLLWQPLHLP